MRTIHLIGYGEAPAKPAGEIRVNDILLWNYGEKSVVKIIRKVSDITLRFIVQENGKDYKRDFRINRLVGFGGHSHTDDSGTFSCPLGSACKEA